MTETMQEAPGAKVPPDNITEDAPAAPLAVPPHVLFKLFGLATTKPAGRLSVKARPLRVVFLSGLLMVNVRLVVPFNGTEAAPNALTMAGGLVTVRMAEDVLPFPAAVESMVTLLVYTPSADAWTLTMIVQVPAARAALLKLMEDDPAAAVTVPPQPFTSTGVVATTRLAGKVSVKLASIATVFPLLMPNVIVLGAFTATVLGLKVLVIEGGCKTVMVAGTVALSMVAFWVSTPPEVAV